MMKSFFWTVKPAGNVKLSSPLPPLRSVILKPAIVPLEVTRSSIEVAGCRGRRRSR